MAVSSLHINRNDLTDTRLLESESVALADGEVRVHVERFGLTTNNITYAVFGDALGYWSYFPVAADWGSVPVWGFAVVTESNAPDIGVDERLFGYFPMSSELILSPTGITPLCFTDTTEHRTALHPWYNRYYRCAQDPVFSEGSMDVQPVLWALFMTGWMLARQLTEAGQVDAVIISSASSKTALSVAWSLQYLQGAQAIGLTSAANRAFVESTGVYGASMTYADDPVIDSALERLAFVDIAGNPAVASAMHVAFADRLQDSVGLGATHRAQSAEVLPMPGPAPRFFFIPDLAEQQAASDGFGSYHNAFAAAWQAFLPWAESWLEIESGQGGADIEAGYQKLLAGGVPARQANVYSW